MAYKSIDELQTLLSQEIFKDRSDNKKAAGRALGTFIEIIVYYLLRQWGENDSIAIESPLSEYGREEITHNVEFTLHPICELSPTIKVPTTVPLTAHQIAKRINLSDTYCVTTKKMIDKGVLQNACVVATNSEQLVLTQLDSVKRDIITLHTYTLIKRPYAMIECKRVGKEGDAKGPQTIEKAKQGAYVAKATSMLQKVRNDKGELNGIYFVNGIAYSGPYNEVLAQLINSDNPLLLRDFTLSIGVVSNHGNWFTSGNQNKEMKVLAQSYDWLLFLTDDGLAQFITDLLRAPKREYQSVREAFLESYCTTSSNSFTKKAMRIDAHFALCNYFTENIGQIEQWFNVISPENTTINDLKQTLSTLKNKTWR